MSPGLRVDGSCPWVATICLKFWWQRTPGNLRYMAKILAREKWSCVHVFLKMKLSRPLVCRHKCALMLRLTAMTWASLVTLVFQEEKLLTDSLPASPPLPLPQQASWLKSSRPIPRPGLAVSEAFCKCELPWRSWLWLWLWWRLWLWFRLWLWLWLCLRLWLLLWGSTLDRSTLTPSWIRYFWLTLIIHACWLIMTINW